MKATYFYQHDPGLTMFKTLLVAVDGSEISHRALEEALAVARAMQASVHAVHVVQTGAFPTMILDSLEPPDVAQQAILDSLEREADEILADTERRAAAAGIRITPHKRWGHPGAEITALAQELGADLTVVGSHGRGRLDRLFLGSVSSYVVDHAPSTVMVVRAGPTARDRER
ncbi:MAG TPA: universal stress protein [Candidatus Methanoculleus thermohydrogenotrophicum]|jgi:nucleotide-binding universal stress UspA family protein|nr:universal stress protein [Candidatus Methanoculleus thermohydrogenotrophicum]HOB18910.1 universal stress protein [Candidatus Methanoculleus thermohydrogenotrophicum]HPZ38789.1 universal stress protein [Candidatus Methanoculleus thermohydrogenotrophicum]HQC92059.1 universal stress protein [Candidatus Methanoculleus thermohydrogenotrophicum]